MTTPPRQGYQIPPLPSLPSPSGSRPRTSLSSSFSFDPSQLVHSYLDTNTSKLSQQSFYALDPNRSILATSPLHSSPRRKRRVHVKDTPVGEHPLAQDSTADVFLDTEGEYDGEGSEDWTIVDRMRLWRHDAIMQHLYETAAFWGDKVLSWTNNKNDAFWLAQIYFLMHQYSRAERLLTRPFAEMNPTDDNEDDTQLLTNGHAQPEASIGIPLALPRGKGKGKERAVDQPSQPRQRRANRAMHLDLVIPNIDASPGLGARLPLGPGAPDLAAAQADGAVPLVDTSVACRYLAAQCQLRQGKWAEAGEMLGEANPFRGTDGRGPKVANTDGGIKIEASMCFLRGMLRLKMNRGESAKECFMEALALDVKCYEAFDQLISGEMMTADEEWEFVQGLAYKQQIPEDGEFVQLIYTSRLRKYQHAEEHELTRRRLVEEFGLKDNVDVLYGFADAAYSQSRWVDCYIFTSRILALVDIHEHAMPLHIACMHHLPHLHSKLFILAHELVEKEPEAAMSWYAVGVWYLTSKKWSNARTYFSKTSLMDPRFSPAWIAFGHTFALEGEHDHAVTAYSTAARLFTGSHLPLMYVGMEHIMLSNLDMACEALSAANKMCDSDPLLYNELGVMVFNHGQYDKAAELFQKALELARVTQNSQSTWATTYVNLGCAYIKTGHLQLACSTLQTVLEIDHRHATALAFLGKAYSLMRNYEQAIVRYHESLSIDPLNGTVIELLNIALEANLDSSSSQLLSVSTGTPTFTPSDPIQSRAETEKNMQRSRDAVRALHNERATVADASWRDETGRRQDDMIVE